MLSSRVPRDFYSHLQFKLIITKSTITIMTKSSSNDAKSTDNPTPLTVGSIIDVGCFNKHRQPTVLTTYIYYLIWATHSPRNVTSGRPFIATNSNLAQPLPLGLPCCSEKKSSFFFLQCLKKCATLAPTSRASSDSHWRVSIISHHLIAVTELHHHKWWNE